MAESTTTSADVAEPNPTLCFRCGRQDDFPLYSHSVEQASGPGVAVYMCVKCARDKYTRHVTTCETCRAGVNCKKASDMRRAILTSRRARLAHQARAGA